MTSEEIQTEIQTKIKFKYVLIRKSSLQPQKIFFNDFNNSFYI
jgi:hypothetical protein